MKRSLLINETKSMFKNPKLLIAIIAVIAIPILYAGMFLWAFWDPYDFMDDLPVAVVNTDEGVYYEGEYLDLGDELVKNLKEEADFDFHFVSEKDGYEGLLDEDYYVLIKIPEYFSDNATTLLDDPPEKLELIYVPNESFNFLSAQMGETAMLHIEQAVEEKVIETYAETMFDQVDELSDGLAEASDGSGEINEGSVELHDGASELKDGASELESGSNELKGHLHELAEQSIVFNDGMSTAQQGASELAQGLNELTGGIGQLKEGQEQLLDGSNEAKSGAEQLAAGTTDTKHGLSEVQKSVKQFIAGSEELNGGAKQLEDSLGQWSDGANGVVQGAEVVHNGIAKLEQELLAIPNLPEEMKQSLKQLVEVSSQVNEGTKGLSESATQIKAGATNLASGANELNNGHQALQQGVNELYEGSKQLESGANSLASGQQALTDNLALFGDKLGEAQQGIGQLTTGSRTLADGTQELAEGSSAIVDGTDQLAEGSTDLADGTGELAEGTITLSEGTVKLVDGSGELTEKLADAAKESSIDTTDETYNMMANPVEVNNEEINEVPNYGTGFAPYFLSLGLFVGALLLSIVYPLREPASRPTSGFNWFISKFGVLFGIGVLQALIAAGILLLGLGLEVTSVPLFITFAIITSLVFITLIQFLVTCFDDPGRFIAIITLILQLTTSAGTFPLELIPKVLQPLNAFLPMTYSVQGFKAVISSGNYTVMWQNAGVLLGFTILFMIGTLTYFMLHFKRKYYQEFTDEEEITTA